MPFSVVPPTEPAEEEARRERPDGGPESAPENERGEPISGATAPRFGRLRPNARTSNLDALGTHELVTLVEDLEDDRARARVREGIWISVIVHIILFWLYAYGPQVLLHRPRVINPAEIMALREKEYETLDLPPDALKQLKPKDTKVLSDKDRVAQTRNPTLDRKTLAQLEAMKPPGRPSPHPSAQPTQQESPQQPVERPQQNAAQAPPQRPAPPVETPSPQPTQQAQNNPPPRQTTQQPNFHALGSGSAHDLIQNAIRNPGAAGGGGGMGAPSRHPGINTGMEILSDTMGVDFAAYMARLKYLIERAWYPLIPEAARPPISKQGVVQIRFKIGPNGELIAGGMHLDGRSGDVSLDRAAWGGVTGGSPFPPLPKDFKGPYLEIRGAFLYNLEPDQLK